MTHATIRERRVVTLRTMCSHVDEAQAVREVETAHRQRVDRLRMTFGIEEVGAPLVHPFAHVLIAIAEGREIETRVYRFNTPEWRDIDHMGALEIIARYSCTPDDFRVKEPT